jgi:hypothetical protein
MELETVIKIVEKMSQSNVREFEMDGLKVRFKDSSMTTSVSNNIPILKSVPVHTSGYISLQDQFPAPKHIIPDPKPEELFKPLSPFELMTEEEILMYATPRYDEIQAEKKAHQDKILSEGKP